MRIDRIVFILIIYSSCIEACPRTSKNVFRRLKDGVQTTRCSRCQSESSILRNRHKCVYADERINFLSLKGKRQPTFSSYHETCLYGGYLSSYGLAEQNETERNEAVTVSSYSWSHVHFDPIDKHENREDAFFVLQNTLFLLIYTRFENITFRHLYWWQKRRPFGWVDVPLDVDPMSEFMDTNIQNGGLAWTRSDDEPRRLYLMATDGWGKIIVSKLDVVFSDQGSQSRPVSASIRHITSDQTSPVNSGGAIVALTNVRARLYAFYGTQTCGFHWHKSSIVLVDLNSTSPTLEYSFVNGVDLPPWAFGGPIMVERYGSDWFMFGGSVASGHMATEFDGQIWIFQLSTLTWRKSKSKVPEHLNPYEMCSALDSEMGAVYLADFRNIYKANTSHLRQQC